MSRKKSLALTLAAVLLLGLCACGDAVPSNAEPEGIQTFGAEIDPSAQPNQGETIPGSVNPSPAGTSSGVITEHNSGTEPVSPEPSSQAGTGVANAGNGTGTAGNGTGTAGNSNGNSSGSGTGTGTQENSGGSGTGTDTQHTETPATTSPSISPPASASTATVQEVQPYVGGPLSKLLEDLGYPQRSEYEDVDEDDPDTDRIGTLYFNGFVVTTLRDKNGETIIGVQVDDPNMKNRFDP